MRLDRGKVTARRIKVQISYDGTAYHGWQVQAGQETIQGVLQRILAEIEGAPVLVAGSGRTDAGVHALAQVGAFTLQNPIPAENLRQFMNKLLPHDIRILSAEDVHPDFDPRRDATAKTYEYRIVRSPICSPFDRRYVHHHPFPLDESVMIRLAPVLEGEHDFSAFSATDATDIRGFSKVRTIFSSTLARHGDRLIYRVRGSGFLKYMVRNLMGTLIDVGKGNISEACLHAMLQPGYPGKAGLRMPASGLFLVSVEYDSAGRAAAKSPGPTTEDA
jgi:tRNA pseudouridine38-40 synthase